jgi:hypothetical protein
MKNIKSERSGEAVTTQIHIRDVFGSNMGWSTGYPASDFCDLPASLQVHVGAVSRLDKVHFLLYPFHFVSHCTIRAIQTNSRGWHCRITTHKKQRIIKFSHLSYLKLWLTVALNGTMVTSLLYSFRLLWWNPLRWSITRIITSPLSSLPPPKKKPPI